MNLTRALKSEAIRLGFDAVGIAPAVPSPNAALVHEWLHRGYHGTMEYMARNVEKRLDPSSLFPSARSVVCLATLYRARDIPSELASKSSRGVVSRYAWGDDYHELIIRRAERLLDWLRQRGGDGADGRAFCDTAPVLERELAARAGIGWIGKNTLVLNRRLGSYFFLAEIVVNVELEPDAPTPNHCGSCRRCLDACPTGAFPEPGALDATKCISYLTIELKGAVPEEHREPMGNRVFGCDICQEVCPWNRKAATSDAAAFAPRPGLFAPKLAALMALTVDEFRRIFKGSPVKRAKRAGLLRNVAIALGNSGDSRAIPALRRGLSDDEPIVRQHAAWGLCRIGGEEAQSSLRKALSVETDDGARAEIESALRRIRADA